MTASKQSTTSQSPPPKGQPRVLCFGEVLWDLLPDGPHLGGAPLNVAWHIARHSVPVKVVSAVGADELGRRARDEISSGGVDVTLLRTLADVATGTVNVRLDPDGDASYHFPEDVAWDHIAFDECLAHAAATCGAVIYGSLAMRYPANRDTLSKTLDQLPPEALTVMDINLRPPFRERDTILQLAKRARVLKLNFSELEFLLDRTVTDETLPEAMALLHVLTNCEACCLTLGERGAVWWHSEDPGAPIHHPGHVGLYPLANTIGAGDSFLASLVCSLLQTGVVDRDALDHAGRVAAYVTSTASATPRYDPDQLPPPES